MSYSTAAAAWASHVRTLHRNILNSCLGIGFGTETSGMQCFEIHSIGFLGFKEEGVRIGSLIQMQFLEFIKASSIGNSA